VTRYRSSLAATRSGQDSPDKYTIVATVATMRGAKTISADSIAHRAYLFQPEYGKTIKSWPLAPCESPTGIAYDRTSDRIFVGCGRTSVVVNGT